MSKNMSYSLYRNLYDIVHPTISRKNISNYKIIIDSNLEPLQVYYPEKEVLPDKIIIYIPNKIVNSNTYEYLAKQTSTLLIVISYFGSDYSKYYDIIKYISNNIDKTGIDKNNIILMTDNEGYKIINDCTFKLNKVILLKSNNEFVINKKNFKEILYIEEYVEEFINNFESATNEYIYSRINEFID